MNRKILGVLCGMVMAGTLAAVPAARAVTGDQASRLTFQQPFRVSASQVLPPGTYWFQKPNPDNNPHLVAIYNADRSKLMALTTTMDVDRPQPTNETQMTFAEPSGRSLAMESWFYPNESIGQEFVYSHREASRLSESPQVTILAQSAR